VAYGNVATTKPLSQAVLDDLLAFAQSPSAAITMVAISSLSVVSAARYSLAKPYNVTAFAGWGALGV
jgi:hypothetical protein